MKKVKIKKQITKDNNVIQIKYRYVVSSIGIENDIKEDSLEGSFYVNKNASDEEISFQLGNILKERLRFKNFVTEEEKEIDIDI